MPRLLLRYSDSGTGNRYRHDTSLWQFLVSSIVMFCGRDHVNRGQDLACVSHRIDTIAGTSTVENDKKPRAGRTCSRGRAIRDGLPHSGRSCQIANLSYLSLPLSSSGRRAMASDSRFLSMQFTKYALRGEELHRIKSKKKIIRKIK